MSEAYVVSAPASMAWQSAADTHTGNVRKVNEDAVLARPDRALWTVADGMGGHDAGDYASKKICETLDAVDLEGNLADAVDAVEDALFAVNDELRAYARSEFEGRTVGSTVVVMLSKGPVGVALWAGDSRAYRLRQGKLEQITRDHNPISDLLESGAVSEEEALGVDTNVITRAVGGQGALNIDIVVFDIAQDDTFLLCSDGLYRELTRAELTGCLQQDLEGAAATMMNTCLRTDASDNVSFVICRPQVVH